MTTSTIAETRKAILANVAIAERIVRRLRDAAEMVRDITLDDAIVEILEAGGDCRQLDANLSDISRDLGYGSPREAPGVDEFGRRMI